MPNCRICFVYIPELVLQKRKRVASTHNHRQKRLCFQTAFYLLGRERGRQVTPPQPNRASFWSSPGRFQGAGSCSSLGFAPCPLKGLGDDPLASGPEVGGGISAVCTCMAIFAAWSGIQLFPRQLQASVSSPECLWRCIHARACRDVENAWLWAESGPVELGRGWGLEDADKSSFLPSSSLPAGALLALTVLLRPNLGRKAERAN